MNVREVQQPKGRRGGAFATIILIVLLAGSAYAGYHFYFKKTRLGRFIIPQNLILYDSTLTAQEQKTIQEKIDQQKLSASNDTTIKATITSKPTETKHIVAVYVPVTNFNAVRQKTTTDELKTTGFLLPEGTEQYVKDSFATFIGVPETSIGSFSTLETITEDQIALVPVSQLDASVKLLTYDDGYYLDTFSSGALFRVITFDGASDQDFASLDLNQTFSKEDIFKINMTGVTALTRVMMKKLADVQDPTYFSEKIADFLADADITHVSNEVSFKTGCTYSNTSFCAPPDFIETLKASGVDLVELTGNHNNDVGSEYNTETINLYKELGWNTVGGGLNSTEAAKPFNSDAKGNKVTILAYNYADSPSGGAIAGPNKAGANSFNYTKIEQDIKTAKDAGNFVIVDIQYWECYSYPDGFKEFPECDIPIGKQEEDFKKVASLGADMVIGTQAHQPQTYERVNGVPIYYGLGNLYFEQTSWPGTERGIILSHYFKDGKLLQTKLTPTVYDKALQTRIMTDEEADYLLTRLHDAR